MDICGVYIGLMVLQKPWLKLKRGGDNDGADDVGVIKLDGDVIWWWLPFNNELCISPIMPLLCASDAPFPRCVLCIKLFIFGGGPPLLRLAVSDDEFVSLVQWISTLAAVFIRLLLFGVLIRCVRNFSSRLHLARRFEN